MDLCSRSSSDILSMGYQARDLSCSRRRRNNGCAAGLSLPATVQHFIVWRDPDQSSEPGNLSGESCKLTIANIGGHGFPADGCAARRRGIVWRRSARTCPRIHQMPGAVWLFFFRCGCTKRVHAQGVCGKEILERLATRKGSRGLIAGRESAIHRR